MSKAPTIDYAYASLESSITEAMTWTPRIFFPSPHFQIDHNQQFIINTSKKINKLPQNNAGIISVECTPMINLVQLLSIATTNTSSLENQTTLLNYPPGALFKFTGFKGINDKQKLSSYIIATAQQHGSSLSNLT